MARALSPDLGTQDLTNTISFVSDCRAVICMRQPTSMLGRV